MKEHHSAIQKIFQSSIPRVGSSGVACFVARQPIFDTEGKIKAYELLFRDPSLKLSDEELTNSHIASSRVMIDGFNILRPSLLTGQKFYINFTEELLKTDIPSILPPNICTLEILENVKPSKGLIENLTRLKQAGYSIALDDYQGQDFAKDLLPLVDIIKVDVQDISEITLRLLVSNLKKYPAELLAEKVEDAQMESLCKSLGFSLFQGFFFSKPEIISGKKITPSEVTKTRLLAFSSKKEISINEITNVIQADVSLTLKLLSYINSLYFGLPTKVKTIHHALMILGNVKLKQWLYATTLADINAVPLSHELAYISALRAKFLENLASIYFKDIENASKYIEQFFILGLFSLLEIIMQMSFHEISTSVPMEDEVLESLQGKGKFSLWLKLIEAYEVGDWEATKKIATPLGLRDEDITFAYTSAAVWSAALYGGL